GSSSAEASGTKGLGAISAMISQDLHGSPELTQVRSMSPMQRWMNVKASTRRVSMAIGSHATVSVVLTFIRAQGSGQMGNGAGHSAWNEKPPATGWILVTWMGR